MAFNLGERATSSQHLRSGTETMAPRNSFLDFLDHNIGDFAAFSNSARALKVQEEAWRTSGELDELTEKAVSFRSQAVHRNIPVHQPRETARMNFNRPVREKSLGKLTAQLRRDVEHIVVDTTSGLVTEALVRMGFSLPNIIRFGADCHAWVDKIRRLNGEYFASRRPLLEEHHKTKTVLFSVLGDYLRDDYRRPWDFMEFVGNEEYEQDRQAIRPFLIALAEEEHSARQAKRESLLDGVQKDLVERTESAPSLELLKNYFGVMNLLPTGIKSITQEKNGSLIVDVRKNADLDAIREWLQFSLEIVRRMNPEVRDIIEPDSLSFEEMLPHFQDTSFWPQKMKDSLHGFISRRVGAPIGNIKIALEQYRKPEQANGAVGIEIFDAEREKIKTHGEATREDEPEEKKGGSDEIKPPKEIASPLPVGVIQRSVRSRHNRLVLLTEDELSDKLDKVARQQARDDHERMREDLGIVMDIIRREPFGPGSTDLYVEGSVNSRAFRKRRFSPHDRPGLDTLHGKTTRLRVVFGIAKVDGKRVIVLEKIGDHAEIEQDYPNQHTKGLRKKT